jgi:hypothetical protein
MFFKVCQEFCVQAKFSDRIFLCLGWTLISLPSHDLCDARNCIIFVQDEIVEVNNKKLIFLILVLAGVFALKLRDFGEISLIVKEIEEFNEVMSHLFVHHLADLPSHIAFLLVFIPLVNLQQTRNNIHFQSVALLLLPLNACGGNLLVRCQILIHDDAFERQGEDLDLAIKISHTLDDLCDCFIENALFSFNRLLLLLESPSLLLVWRR